MTIEDFKVGQIVTHTRYGKCKVDTLYPNKFEKHHEGILLSDLSEEGITLLNQDRQIKNMPYDNSNQNKLIRVFESNLTLLQ